MAKSEKMGKVPKGWKMVQLGEVLNYEQPQKYLVLSEEYDKRTGIPVLTAGKSFILGYTEEQFGIYRNLPVIIFDDFTTDSRYVNFPFKLKSSAIKILKNKNNENISFSIYNAVQLLKYKPGSEHKRFWISEYSKIYVFLPPPHEQRKIAEILETVDKALEKADKIIEKHKRIKQGLMQDLLTKGIDENGQMRSEKTHRFRDSPLGRIPQEWDAVKLGEIAGINMGQSPPSTVVNEREIGTPFLQGNAEFTNEYPAPQKWVIKPLRLSRKGDILISVRAPVGEVNKADRVYCIGRGLGAISFKTIDEVFGWFGLIHWKYQLEHLSQGSTFEAISRDDLKNLLILIPTFLPEQRKIASILSKIDKTIEKEQQYKAKLQRIKRGLMEDLLIGKVRVNHLIEKVEKNVSQT